MQNVMMQFLNDEGGKAVITWGPTEKDGLVATQKPPESQNKKKALIFMKTQQEVTMENFDDVVFCMENNTNTLEYLSSIANNVFFPVPPHPRFHTRFACAPCVASKYGTCPLSSTSRRD